LATVQEKDIDLELAPGMYWVGGVVVTGGAQPTVRCHTNASAGAFPGIDLGTTMPTAGQAALGWQQTGVAGALPATFAMTGSAGSTPRVFVKVA
jgi:hypothetical protein